MSGDAPANEPHGRQTAGPRQGSAKPAGDGPLARPGTGPHPTSLGATSASAEGPKVFAFTEENIKKAEKSLAKYPPDRRRSAIKDLLKNAQDQCNGWLPRAAIDYVADYVGAPRIKAYEIATFYDMYNTDPVGKIQVRVCTTTPCWLRGSDDVVRACQDALGVTVGESTDDMRFFLREFECLGACANAPMMWIGDDYYEDLDYDSTKAIIEALKRGETPKPGSQTGRQASMPIGGRTSLTEVNG